MMLRRTTRSILQVRGPKHTVNVQYKMCTNLGSETAEKVTLGSIDPNRRLGIVFTCTVCQHRCGKTFSYLSYTKGVVIITCPGCSKHHLIADNLGWFRDQPVNIEILAKERGQEVRRITDVKELADEEDVEGLDRMLDRLKTPEQSE
eukprot:TRINITY_DN11440_c0_g1_i2.p1 TRINITY_DN11440_c0_g1~~TRINITY_DN11440_c0_g1_i2.p1  ORF type:complete len:147 (-),score=23.34 TRINITY_DN11440_c0_g1_i2:78-518(-)